MNEAREKLIEIGARAWWSRIADGQVAFPDPADGGTSAFIYRNEIERSTAYFDALLADRDLVLEAFGLEPCQWQHDGRPDHWRFPVASVEEN